jgi:hypothetical protein
MSLIDIKITEESLDKNTVQYSKEIKIFGVLIFSRHTTTGCKDLVSQFFSSDLYSEKPEHMGFITPKKDEE